MIDKKEIISAIKKAKEEAKERKFEQSLDLIINIKNLDLKKNENQIDDFIELHYSKGKKIKICALIGPELEEEAKKVCDKTIRQDEFSKIGKKEIKKIAREYDYFIAQANIMAAIATTFGKVLGPLSKMPNPKIGCVVPPKANLGPLYEKLQRTIKLSTKKGGSVKTIIGKENAKEEEIIDNILNTYKHFTHTLPGGENNIKNVMIKMTMGPAITVGEETETIKKENNKKKKEERKEVKDTKVTEE